MRQSHRHEPRRHREAPQRGAGFGPSGREREDSDERFELQDRPQRFAQDERDEWRDSPYETQGNRQQGGMRQGFGYGDQERGQDFRSPQNMWDEGGYRGRGNYPMGDFGQSADRGYGQQARRGEFAQGDRTQGGGDYFGYGGEQQGRAQGSYGMSDRSPGYGDWGQGSTSRGAGTQRGDPQFGRGGQGFGEQTGYGAGRGDWNRWGSGEDPGPRRGPKGYTRSDERVKDDVCERLMQEHDLDVGEISIEVQNGKVTLEGSVPDRGMKHRIEDIACGCMGVKDVENRVRVSRETAGSGRDAESDRGSSMSGSNYGGSKRKN